MTASELKKDLNGIGSGGEVVRQKDYIGAIAGIDAEFTQDQFNVLVGLRYNIGSLGVIAELLEYLKEGSYERTTLNNLITSYYDAIIQSNPDNEKYRSGCYNRTEKMFDIFFDGNYGYMPIDAVNGLVMLFGCAHASPENNEIGFSMLNPPPLCCFFTQNDSNSMEVFYN